MQKKIAILLAGMFITAVIMFSNFAASTSAAASDERQNAREKEITVRLHEAQRTITLAPGETGFVSSRCLDNEAVVGGGPTSIPASLTITLSTLFFDGEISGWTVDFRNDGSESVTESPNVGALCVHGQLISDQI